MPLLVQHFRVIFIVPALREERAHLGLKACEGVRMREETREERGKRGHDSVRAGDHREDAIFDQL